MTLADAPPSTAAPSTDPAPARPDYGRPTAATPWARRVNWRVVAFVGVLAFLFGVPTYQYLRAAMTGGITEGANGAKLVDFKAMVSFPFDQQFGTADDVPARYRALDGQTVVLRGEIAPSGSAGKKVGDFALVYSVAQCCYSGPPQIQHFVQCTVADDAKVDYVGGPVVVRGTLSVDVAREDGQITGVYHLKVNRLDPA